MTQMPHRYLYQPHLLRLSFNLIFLVFPAILSASTDEQYIECARQFECGDASNVSYPFWGDPQPPYCGLPEFRVECQNRFPVIQIMSENYRVMRINHQEHVLQLASLNLYNHPCPSRFTNITMSYLFRYAPGFGNLTMFFGCSSNPSLASRRFRCGENNTSGEINGYFTIGTIPTDGNQGNCNVSITVPVLQTAVEALQTNLTSLDQVLSDGFEVQWITDNTACLECVESGGRCGYNTTHFRPICFCPHQPYTMRCPAPPDTNIDQGGISSSLTRILIGISIVGVSSIMVTVAVFCWFRRRSTLYKLISFWKNKRTHSESIEAMLEKCGSLAPKRYSYSDVKKMTCSFKEKLGQGGYGCVYKGKLGDGRLVAVKVLSESKGDGEEFMNEVVSISRTSHVNIVTLLGFCFKGPKRALVYEFMPNGSLDKYIYDEKQMNKISVLGCERIFRIAVSVARGIEYLHCGCNTRILHLDIKPQNILLDWDFVPKISDFGLAKLCPRKDGIISTLGARGTVGYIAPEVFSRNFGVVSHKSDVYSYGMMLLEMVGGRRNIEVGFGHSSETYFPHWIYKRLELEEDVKLLRTVNKEGEEVARRMILVGLWCIQTDPAKRPTIDRVVDMLEGSHEALQVPPKPFPSSPIRETDSVSNTSTSNSFLQDDKHGSSITVTNFF